MKTALIALLAAIVNAQQNVSTQLLDDVVHEGCGAVDYYAELTSTGPTSSWTRDAVRQLTTRRHATELPIVGGNDQEDIIDALRDLFAGTEPSTVKLLYRHVNFPAVPANTPETWRRGDLWPQSAGAKLGTPAAVDVHAKWPVDWTVNDGLEDLWFGECGTVESDDACVTPAIDGETAADTAQDAKIKLPPAEYRGDVARALFYVALRYETELGLKLTDCPPFAATEFGYLSQLLTWHEQDPVVAEEQVRNDRACARWQGNRNVFVDYPELVTQFFGQADSILEGTHTYSACTVPTDAPTATPNDCSAIQPGDVTIFLFNSEPDQIVFFPLQDIPDTVDRLYVTDKAWNGTDFVTDEGVIEYAIPDGGLGAGGVFAYGVEFPDDEGEWIEHPTEIFDLGAVAGDNMFVYCMNADGEPHFISALSYGGDWVLPGKESYTFNESALPAELEMDGAVALPFSPNYLYNGIRVGRRSELIEAFKDPTNYEGSNTAYDIDTSGAAVSSIGLLSTIVLALCSCLL